MSSEAPRTLKIGDFAQVKGGKRMPSGTSLVSVKTKHPYLRIVDFKDGTIEQSNLQYVPEDVFPKISRYTINSDELYISIVGTIGLVGSVPRGLSGANLTENAAKICQIDESKVDARYLAYFLRSDAGQSAIKSLTVGSTQPKLALFRIEQIEVPCPALDIQQGIAEILGSLDDRITLLRETNATLEAIAQALFKSWFVDFDPVRAKMEGRAPEGMDEATAALFPDSFEETELGAVPRGWRWGTLSDFATFQNGYAFKSKDWTDTGHPVIKIGDVKPGIIDLSNCSYVSQQTVVGLERFRLKRGDLLVGMTGYVGETGLVPATEPAAYLNQRVGRIATKMGCSDLGYVYCIARSAAFKDFAEAQSHGSAQANVSGTSLMAYSAVLAPLTLIDVFNSAIAGMLEAILSNHEQAQTLLTLRDTLLPRLISGQIHIDVLDISREDLQDAGNL